MCSDWWGRSWGDETFRRMGSLGIVTVGDSRGPSGETQNENGIRENGTYFYACVTFFSLWSPLMV